MIMNVTLTGLQIAELKAAAKIETDRDIYCLSFDLNEITINGNWSIKIGDRNNFHNELISAIENYCSKENIEWETRLEYAAWCN
jgi:hypothetical protein